MQDETLTRIEAILDLYGSNKTTLARKINIAQSTLSSMFLRNTKPNDSMLNSILCIYKDVRKEWLYEGQEPMLRSQLEDGGFTTLHEIIRNMSETIKSQQETIDELSKHRKKTAASVA